MRHTKLLLILMLSFSLLTGCWDKVEINQLAIVTMVGMDYDHASNRYTAFYQVINPKGLASNKGGTAAPLYTYHIKRKDIASTHLEAFDILPRVLFPDHIQGIMVSQRLAEKGLKDFINFIERQPNRRSNIPVLVTSDSLEQAMKTYTPLESIPGVDLRSLIKMQSKQSGKVSEKNQVLDLSESMETGSLVFLPMIRLIPGGNLRGNMEGLNDIDANQGNFRLDGTVLMKYGKMVGMLNGKDSALLHFAKGQSTEFFKAVHYDENKKVVLKSMIKPRIHKELVMEENKPVMKLRVNAALQIYDSNANVVLTQSTLKKMQKAFDREVQQNLDELVDKSKRKGWDLFDIQGQLKMKREDNWKKGGYWRKVQVRTEVNSAIRNVGNLTNPYKGG
ncbi:Ger(x)C family spore germination protein [Fictibacillus fluitans]|uniref:Ger(X)C family spore germination protein n=1 Tax=Fictibacillus fluitans TaxID=3058422 RepID=A0ABT8HTE6_9BACL|nr:Ger(x)C family spore germination protein [Fictibacillus sp. NE201]MDN4524050.1 Ger(x)C family spore germination protein [Fictibacillus sp. NE201]